MIVNAPAHVPTVTIDLDNEAIAQSLIKLIVPQVVSKIRTCLVPQVENLLNKSSKNSNEPVIKLMNNEMLFSKIQTQLSSSLIVNGRSMTLSDFNFELESASTTGSGSGSGSEKPMKKAFSGLPISKTKCKKKKLAKSIWSEVENEMADVMAQKMDEIMKEHPKPLMPTLSNVFE